MAQKTIHRFTVEATPEAAFAVLCDFDFEVAQQTAQEGTKSARVVEKKRDEHELIYVVECAEYARSIKGGLDRKKTEDSSTEVRWDLDKKSSVWTYSSHHGPRVKVWGSTWVESVRGATTIASELNAEIKLPLIGGKIEKVIIKATNEFWPTFEKIFQDFLDR